ncbi:hypothetical protein SADUNF_Sadunf02G0182500 [Salix dunnii]|uniref:Uncharacterized protein n=1 Tax=Salix dunnii TaxID=1413687 RepID=A0A835TKU6_9ROSI|nr:hypothetical protein SADUNF_Sadunf02G0182500 [Salix dunnii]
MGNCLASSKIVSQNAKLEQQSEEDEVLIKQAATSLASSRRESPKQAERGKAKMVRLGLDEGVKFGKDGEMGETTTSKGGGTAVRIRVVVTREELKQILNFRKNIKNSSVEEIIGALRLRERRVDQVGTSSDRGVILSSSWKPVLDSIPEEH